MSTHVKLTTIHGESWFMHKDNIKAVNLVTTPDQFMEDWKKEKVVLITSTEINQTDGKNAPWQFMVANTMEELEDELCNL